MGEPIPASDQTEPKAQAGTDTKLTEELKAIAEANSEATPDAHLDDMEIHQPGAEMSNKEKLAMRNLFEKYPEDLQEVLVQIGEGESAVEVRLCGEGNGEQLTEAAKIALSQLERTFGRPLNEIFPGLKIYFADGIIDGGGLALAEENAIILDTVKQSLTLEETEKVLVEKVLDEDGKLSPKLRPGDWLSLSESPSTLGAQITIVHEVGHILDEKVNGNQQSVAFQGLNQAESPTLYGSFAAHEDYAESFTYLVCGQDLEEKRRQIIQSDITLAAA